MAFAALKGALAVDSLSGVLTLAQPVAARLVIPGQELAVFQPLGDDRTDPSAGVTRPRRGCM